MTQTSLPWGGTVTGDAGPYTDDQWSDTWRKLFAKNRATEGVFPDYGNELQVTNPAGTTLRVRPGAAIIDGKFYENTADVDLAGAAPGGGSNFYTVVARKDFALQTVRAALLGPDIVSPPTVTQADGVTWEVALATAEITSGGVVTITDARVFCHHNTKVSTTMLDDLAVTGAKIADATITAAKLIDGAGSGVDADLLDGSDSSVYTNITFGLEAVSDITLTNTPTLIPGMTANLTTGTYLIFASVPLIATGSAAQYSQSSMELFKDGVLQNGKPLYTAVVPAAGQLNYTLSYVWRITVSGTQTVEVRGRSATGSTATVNTDYTQDKAWALRV